MSFFLIWVEEFFVELIKLLPSWFRYPLTALGFYPTMLKIRLSFWLNPRGRRLWDRVPGTSILLGTAPLWESDVMALVQAEGVGLFINLCREWHHHEGLYARLGVESLWLPTIDFEAPSLEYTLRGVDAICDATARGTKVYVHCKAGRGRSVCIVLAYLIMQKNLSAKGADELVRSSRPHISVKWNLPLFDIVAKMAADARAKALASTTGDESPTAYSPATALSADNESVFAPLTTGALSDGAAAKQK
jgi:atypical dual specificity phosphatase